MTNKSLIFVNKESIQLFYCLSMLQSKNTILDIIFTFNFSTEYIEKLIKCIIYVLQMNYINNINIYTKDKELIKQIKDNKLRYNLENDRFCIKLLNFIECDTNNQILGLNNYQNIYIIENEHCFSCYNSEIFIPPLTIENK